MLVVDILKPLIQWKKGGKFGKRFLAEVLVSLILGVIVPLAIYKIF
jgi:hypothetical protein